MTPLILLAALLWEYAQPRPYPSPIQPQLDRFSGWLLEHFNGGTREHGWLAWGVGALLPALGIGLVGVVLGHASSLLALAWGIGVLYFSMGYKRIAQCCLDVAGALVAHDTARAQRELSCCHPDLEQTDMDEDSLARITVEALLRNGLTRFFGVIFWFVVFGPFGAALYFLSHLALGRWQGQREFLAPTETVVEILDWLPVRAMALSFAIVGNYEDAMSAWRETSKRPSDDSAAILLAAGAAALGVRQPGDTEIEPSGNEPPAYEYIQGALNLVLRAVLLWLVVGLVFWLGAL